MQHEQAGGTAEKVQKICGAVALSGLGPLLLLACGGHTLEPVDAAQEGGADIEARAPGALPAGSAARVADAAGVSTALEAPAAAPRATGPAPDPMQEPAPGTGTDPMAVDPNACPYPNYPATQWSPPEWVAYQPVVPADSFAAEVALGELQASMIGSWHGVASTPWTTPYEVEFAFDADGGYASRCTEHAECCRALYYGTDDDTALKRWRVEDATLRGEVFGEIDVAFDYPREDGTLEYGLPAWQGKLSHIERDASGDGLRFEFATSSGYGPVRYDLRRVK